MGGRAIVRLCVVALVIALSSCGATATQPSPTPVRTTNGRVEVMTPTPTSAGSRAPQVLSGTAAIEVGDQFFLPSQITVKVGTTVTWINHGQVLHTATARDNSFNSSNLEFGGTYKFTFTKAGRFPYYCMNHSDMFGEVLVEPAGP
ncbi:MAG: hypothetical protein E6I57_10840 [Chloroflexi bacterium]|nr:MAG: hypothetical protein E6I57_10840 [Chloroflexota bacterium]